MKSILFSVLALAMSSAAMAQPGGSDRASRRAALPGEVAIVLTNDLSHYTGSLVSDTGDVVVVNVPDHGAMRFPWDAVLSVSKAPEGLLPTAGEAQNPQRGPFSRGTSEITILAGGGVLTGSTTGGGSTSNSNSNSETDFSVLSSVAFYVMDGFAIEPEVGLTFMSPASGNTMNSYSGLLSLDYTLKNESSVAPFFRAGYGVSNGIQEPIARDLLMETGHLYGSGNSSDPTVDILYFGVGIKTLLTRHIAFRTELGYKGQSFTVTDPYSSSGISYSYYTIGLQFGFTFLSGVSGM